ncbi:MAG: hypothetical protein ACFFD6_07695 [Candidatus Thorarchaeota archaeon]
MKQDKLTKHTIDNETEVPISPPKRRTKSTRHIEINISDFKTHPLWDILVETARMNPRYANLAGHIREHILIEQPDISPRELAAKLSITLGESIVILEDVKADL